MGQFYRNKINKLTRRAAPEPEAGGAKLYKRSVCDRQVRKAIFWVLALARRSPPPPPTPVAFSQPGA